MIHNSEFVAWAKEEAARIERGESQRYHACFCDPPYGLEFMGKHWDRFACDRAVANPLGHSSNPNVRGRRTNPISKPHLLPSSRPVAPSKYQDWTRQWAAALIPLFYPGALVFCFGGTRTWHRLACGFEDAGFQIWDTLMWLHGQGFPKAQDISKLIDKASGNERKTVGLAADFARDGYRRKTDGSHVHPTLQVPNGDRWSQAVTVPGSAQSGPWMGHKTTALKPAWEPVLCFKAPSQGKTYAELAMEFGSGALNVDAGRIGISPNDSEAMERCNTPGSGRFHPSTGTSYGRPSASGLLDTRLGRYPANLALECTCEELEIVDAPVCGDINGNEPTSVKPRQGRTFGEYARRGVFTAYRGKAIRHTDPECPAAMLDAQAGIRTSRRLEPWHAPERRKSGDVYGKYSGLKHPAPPFGGDSGGPSRFFYCAKASRSEREAGCNELPEVVGAGKYSEFEGRSLIDGQWQNTGNPRRAARNDHPTVKPLALCRWLATLLLPPESVKPRRLLVPFAGTGSEIIGALQAGWDEVIGIEQDAHYCEIAAARTANAQAQPYLFEPKGEQLDLK